MENPFSDNGWSAIATRILLMVLATVAVGGLIGFALGANLFLIGLVLVALAVVYSAYLVLGVVADRMGIWPTVTLVVVLVGSIIVVYDLGYRDGADDAFPAAVDTNPPDRKTPVGDVRSDCTGKVCDVTVTVEEWREYEMLAVQDVSGNVAETYYLHSGDESVNIEGVQQSKHDELAVYVPVRDGGPYNHVWNEFIDLADGELQSFGGEVDRGVTVGVEPSGVHIDCPLGCDPGEVA